MVQSGLPEEWWDTRKWIVVVERARQHGRWPDHTRKCVGENLTGPSSRSERIRATNPSLQQTSLGCINSVKDASWNLLGSEVVEYLSVTCSSQTAKTLENL